MTASSYRAPRLALSSGAVAAIAAVTFVISGLLGYAVGSEAGNRLPPHECPPGYSSGGDGAPHFFRLWCQDEATGELIPAAFRTGPGEIFGTSD